MLLKWEMLITKTQQMKMQSEADLCLTCMSVISPKEEVNITVLEED